MLPVKDLWRSVTSKVTKNSRFPPGKTESTAMTTEVLQKDAPKKQAAFLVETGSISHAARAANMARITHYRWLESSEGYRELFEAAKQESLENLEREARFRAVQGLRQFKFTKDGSPLMHPVTGEPYYEEKRSDVLLIFLLKALAPKKYREQTQMQLGGDVNVGGRVRVVEDDNWYGNRDRIAELTAGASVSDSDGLGPSLETNP
jgi:hypothetical protein